MPTDFEEWTKKVPIIYQNETSRNTGEIHSVVSSLDKKQSFGYRDLGTSIRSKKIHRIHLHRTLKNMEAQLMPSNQFQISLKADAIKHHAN